jgi:hypothetical protein
MFLDIQLFLLQVSNIDVMGRGPEWLPAWVPVGCMAAERT